MTFIKYSKYAYSTDFTQWPIQLNGFKNKIIKMNNPYKQYRRSAKQCFLDNSKKHTNQNRTLSTAQTNIAQPYLKREFLQARRENYLNTGYNNRKQKLEDITYENVKIFLKLSGQKSAYSREQLRKSYEENASISRRLSQSKIFNRSSSRSSARSSKILKQRPSLKPPKMQYKFQANSISTIGNSELQKFTPIFHPSSPYIPCSSQPRQNKVNHAALGISKTTKTVLQHSQVKLPKILRNSNHNNNNNQRSVNHHKRRNKNNYSQSIENQQQSVIYSRKINQKSQQNTKQNMRSKTTIINQNQKQGAFLHIVMQQMFNKPKQK